MPYRKNPALSLFVFLPVLIFLTVLTVNSFAQDRFGGPRGKKPRQQIRPNAQLQENLTRSISSDAGDPQAPILFCIGIHIEPFGATVSSLVGDRALAPKEGMYARPAGDYNNAEYFRRHVEEIRKMAQIVQKHGGKMTVQAQTAFTRVCYEKNEKILEELKFKGHEIAIHFHEDAHLGKNCNELEPGLWTAVMKEEIGWLKKAGAGQVNYWSGGNIYPHILEAASNAGLWVMSDYKNPRKQETDESLLSIHPWRPAGEPNEGNVSEFSRHDPAGKIIYLPDGIFKSADFKERKAGGTAAFLDYLTDGLERSLRAAKKERVNVFHITLHPGELKGPKGNDILDTWLTQVIDPLVKQGKLKWATFSEMADKYVSWEKANPASVKTAKPYMTFAVNVHDWVNVEESADIVLKLVDIFNKYNVRGDFYFTAPVAEAYMSKHPEVISKLKASNMTISYHVRPPSPIYNGFDSELKKLDDESLKQAVRDYETYGLDLRTGKIDKSRPGGYTYVSQVFGKSPVVVSPQAKDRRIRSACEDVYKSIGAKMEVLYHEEGTPKDNPFQHINGLLIRPSDFSITRWSAPGAKKESFWWNKLTGPAAGYFDPVSRLKQEIAAWSYERPPFITALIHENNFYNSGAESWKAYYLGGEDYNTPLSPPYDLDVPNIAKPRSKEEQARILKAYESMVAYAAENLNVVTSQDIVELAQNQY